MRQGIRGSASKRVEHSVLTAVKQDGRVPEFVHVGPDVYCDLLAEARADLRFQPGPEFAVNVAGKLVPVRASVRLPRGYIVPVMPRPNEASPP